MMNVFTLEIDPREIKLLETNARYMKHEEFNRLVENIRRDGKLTSTPFLCKDDDDRWLCLSGNHRTRAAIEVGLPTITCLATDDPLSKEQRIAIQLSHNAIAGQDDPATLKALYEQILDTSLKQYSGLAKDRAKSSSDVWLARMANYDAWLDAQETVGAAYNVKNVATAVELILKIFQRNVTQCSEGWADTTDNKRYVPIETVIGKTKIPAEDAKVIKKALDTMVGSGQLDAKALYSGITQLCQQYLDSK